MQVDSMNTIGENIKKRRESSGMSQAQLGERIGKTRSAISQYESGKIVPRMGVVEDLARALDVTKADILKSSVSYFMIDMNDADSDEHELIGLYREMTTQQKDAMLVVARAMVG